MKKSSSKATDTRGWRGWRGWLGRLRAFVRRVLRREEAPKPGPRQPQPPRGADSRPITREAVPRSLPAVVTAPAPAKLAALRRFALNLSRLRDTMTRRAEPATTVHEPTVQPPVRPT